jgi:hypothetical protein
MSLRSALLKTKIERIPLGWIFIEDPFLILKSLLDSRLEIVGHNGFN